MKLEMAIWKWNHGKLSDSSFVNENHLFTDRTDELEKASDEILVLIESGRKAAKLVDMNDVTCMRQCADWMIGGEARAAWYADLSAADAAIAAAGDKERANEIASRVESALGRGDHEAACFAAAQWPSEFGPWR